MASPDAKLVPSVVIGAQQVRLSNDRQSIPLPHAHRAAEPTIHLVRDGDAVVAVEITCSCGEHIRVKFDYGATA